MNLPEGTPKFSIADDLDPDGDMSADADPITEYLTYLDCVNAGAVGDMGFTLEDFRALRPYSTDCPDSPDHPGCRRLQHV